MLTSINNVTVVDEHLEWGDYVIRNADRSVKDPMEKASNGYVVGFNIVNGSLALLVNSYVATIILLNNRLRNQPRNVIQLSTVLCSILTIFTDGEEAAYHFWPSDQLCHSFVITLGWPNVILMLYILLALIDQLLAITKPQFYRQKITSRLVIVSSLLINFIFILLLDWVFIFGGEPVRCAYQTNHALTVWCVWCGLFFSCIVLAALIYLKAQTEPRAVTNASPSKKTPTASLIHRNNSLVVFAEQKEMQLDLLIRAVGESLTLFKEKVNIKK